MKPVLILPFLIPLFANPCFAAQSPWVETDGGAMRVIISDNAQNQTRGVLEIRLNPGWKTYWREPGDGGIPPSLVIDGKPVELQFPAPERITENGLSFSGYHVGVGFPFTLRDAETKTLKLSAFVGICSEVCVPFQAEFKLTRDQMDGVNVDRAFSKLPKQTTQENSVLLASRKNSELHFRAPKGSTELFLAPEKGLYLEHPKPTDTGFVASVLKEKTEGLRVDYTLKTPSGAISGFFNMPQ